MLDLNIERQEVIEVRMNSELAKRYLEKYANLEAQRPIKKVRIKNHLNNIKTGLFWSSQIVIGHYYEDGDHRTIARKSILDGHHRLHAIVKADTMDEIPIQVLKIYADKETIRQIYGLFDSKKSARNLGDILKWKIAYHPDLKDRWNPQNYVTVAKALAYSSGHYFAPFKAKFPYNCLPKGTTMGKDDFLSDSLDVSSWWFAIDQLDEFLNDLKDRNNPKKIKDALGVVIYGVLLNSYYSISERGRNGDTFNRTKEFWNEVIEYLDREPYNGPSMIKNLWEKVTTVRIDEKSGMVQRSTGVTDASVVPIFYLFMEAYRKWIINGSFRISNEKIKNLDKIYITKDFFGDGRGFIQVHPVYNANRYMNG